MQTAVLALGRLMLASIFLISGTMKILGWAGVLGAMKAKNLPYTEILLAITIGLELIGGLMIVFNIYPAVPAVLLAGFCLISGAVFHNFWAADAAMYQNQFNHFLKNVALAGGLLFLAGSSRPRNDDF